MMVCVQPDAALFSSGTPYTQWLYHPACTSGWHYDWHPYDGVWVNNLANCERSGWAYTMDTPAGTPSHLPGVLPTGWLTPDGWTTEAGWRAHPRFALPDPDRPGVVCYLHQDEDWHQTGGVNDYGMPHPPFPAGLYTRPFRLDRWEESGGTLGVREDGYRHRLYYEIPEEYIAHPNVHPYQGFRQWSAFAFGGCVSPSLINDPAKRTDDGRRTIWVLSHPTEVRTWDRGLTPIRVYITPVVMGSPTPWDASSTRLDWLNGVLGDGTRAETWIDIWSGNNYLHRPGLRIWSIGYAKGDSGTDRLIVTASSLYAMPPTDQSLWYIPAHTLPDGRQVAAWFGRAWYCEVNPANLALGVWTEMPVDGGTGDLLTCIGMHSYEDCLLFIHYGLWQGIHVDQPWDPYGYTWSLQSYLTRRDTLLQPIDRHPDAASTSDASVKRSHTWFAVGNVQTGSSYPSHVYDACADEACVYVSYRHTGSGEDKPGLARYQLAQVDPATHDPLTESQYRKGIWGPHLEGRSPTLFPGIGGLRVEVTRDESGDSPANLHDAHGGYHHAERSAAGIVHKRADHSTPASWAGTASVTDNPLDRNPRMVQTSDRHLHLVFERDGAAYETTSSDDGATWSTPTVAFTGGKFPFIAVHPHTGTVVRACTVSGTLTASVQHPGEASPTEIAPTDDAGNRITLSGGFSISASGDNQSAWLLAGKIQGESALSDWVSYDNCATFSRIA